MWGRPVTGIGYMKIATWSVNGVNRRLPYLCHWLHTRLPDIVALQKIRVSGKHANSFPRTEIEEVGYHVEELLADDQWGSVAVLIRRRLLGNGRQPEVRQRGLPGRETEGRLLVVDAGPVRVASVYAPYAPCGDTSKHQIRRSIEAKVRWLRGLTGCVADLRSTPSPVFLCGDFNVVLDGPAAPATLSRSAEERDALSSLCALGFADLYRYFHGDSARGINSGTPITSPPDARLHLILGTPSVRVESGRVDLDYRGPIDDLPGVNWAPGAPVIVDIDDESI